MRIVNASYVNTPEFNDPEEWLKRISFFKGILEHLSGQYEVHSIEQINYKGYLAQNNVQYHFLNFRGFRLYFPWRLHRIIKKLRPDIIFINGLIFPLQVIQLRLTLGRTVKIILFHRSEKPLKGIRKYLQRFADRYISAYFFTSSEFGKEWIRNGNLSHKKKIHEVIGVSSIFFPMDKTVVKAKLAITGEPVFLWVGRLNQNKNPLTVVKAFIRFIEYRPGAKLYMIFQSTDLLHEIEALTGKEKRLREAVRLVGKIPHDQLGNWYNSADFIISGSYYEGGGVAVCEAMSCGCIPILTDIISFRRMTGPGKCGFLYKAGHEEDLLSVLLQSQKLDMDKERVRALEQFRKELSFEAIAGKIHDVITSL